MPAAYMMSGRVRQPKMDLPLELVERAPEGKH